MGQDRFIIQASLTPSDTPHSVGHLCTSDQPAAQTSTWQHTTLTCHPMGSEPSLSKRTAADPRLRPRWYWDWRSRSTPFKRNAELFPKLQAMITDPSAGHHQPRFKMRSSVFIFFIQATDHTFLHGDKSGTEFLFQNLIVKPSWRSMKHFLIWAHLSSSVRFVVSKSLYGWTYFPINLLKPTGHVMHQQFSFNNCTFCPHCIYVFCIYLRTNSDLCHLQRKPTGFYNRDEKCLLHGRNWVFK